MPTRTDQVKAAIAACDFWYMHQNYDIRTLNERIEQLWRDVEFHLNLMEEAETREEEDRMSHHLEEIIQITLRIQQELRSVHIRA